MKPTIKAAAILLPLLVATAFATPTGKQTQVTPSPTRTERKTEPPCAICAKLTAPATIGGHLYDPNRECRRVLRYTPTATGKGPQHTIQCHCV
ncbi:MAG: hypothetical protein HYV96_09640 [Opitutae bacterium]|jgi:hypothetical protein|nr:hypothetical protein [Opitutae bacterium]